MAMFTGRKIIYNIFSNYAILNRKRLFTGILNKLKSSKYGYISVVCKHDFVNKTLPAEKTCILPTNKFTQRTHTCGELRAENVGEHVQLAGWMEYQRMGKFIILRDSYGSTQLILPEEHKALQEIVNDLTFESVLRITGKVILRPDGQQNKNMKTGDIEVIVSSLEVLNTAMPQLPFSIRSYNKAKESLQMTYRYLSLRFPEMQRNLRMRSRLIAKMREYLINECDFVDVETPTLFRRTPGGAQEFVVPTRHPDHFYALVQSPQQLKQLLMVGGIDRYFQVARCYRDEGGRNDRQPEFTQLDIEMAFAGREELLSLIENLLIYCWPEGIEPIKLPFERMTYNDVMLLYGTDQPDLRIPYKLQDITEDINVFSETQEKNNGKESFARCQSYALVFPNMHAHLSNSVKTQFSELNKKTFSSTKLLQLKIVNDSWKLKLGRVFSETAVSNIAKRLNLRDGDVLFLSYGEEDDSRKLLGKLRTEFTNIIEATGKKIRSTGYKFLWVVDFPLFSHDNELKKLESTHHPFTQPHPEDEQYIVTEPLKVRGLHYDLVMNGSEIGGGSVRIHNANLQRQVFQLLEIDESQLLHMLNALDSGAPPHCGIALGLDRFVSLLCNAPSIRSVIAFPKTMEGRDMMSGAPSTISEEEKKLYHIRTIK